MKVRILKDQNLERVAESVRPDAKRRVVLPKSAAGTAYHIYSNALGQIVLDPQVTIPASEAWLFKNGDAIASVRRGLADGAEGRVSIVEPESL
jgi:hypothetical protein